jgi:hydrophobe/amphiphile efflux-3 (HAE3) family protein
MTARLLSKLAGGAARRPRLIIALAVVLGLGAAAFALRLEPSASTSTFVSSSSSTYRNTQTFYDHFGEEPVVVLVRGDLQQLILGPDLGRLIGLEGCLSGKVPAVGLANEGGAEGPCGRLDKLGTVKVVFGPGTFLNEASQQLSKQLEIQNKASEHRAAAAEHSIYKAAIARGIPSAKARELGQAARRVTLAEFRSQLLSLALQYGLTSKPSLQNGEFLTQVVFDPTKPAGTPKQRFAYLFPSPNTALISVRMKPGLSQSQRNRTIAEIRAATEMPQWRLRHGQGYLVTGEPVIVSDLSKSITSSIELLLIAVLIVMAGTLGLIFLGRPRLLPLFLALLAAALTFGALSAVGASLTVASIAVLPILIGLAVDYSIQFQSRVAETLEGAPAQEGPDRRPRAIALAAGLGGPTLITAAAASAAAMLVLGLSPVPMVRSFGLLLVVGVAIALFCALTVGAAVMGVLPRRSGRVFAAGSAAGALAAAWQGAGQLLRENPLTRAVMGFALGGALQRPGRVLAVGLLLAALGWGLDTQTRVETDITKLVPQSLGSLAALNTLERETGVGGEVAVLVSGENLTKASTIAWMTEYQAELLKRFGYRNGRGCGRARLCPAFSLPDLFQTQAAAPGKAPPALNQAAVNGVLRTIPAYFSQDVITPDRRVATLSFGIRQMSLQRQQQVIEQMRATLHPPAGVDAQLVGLPVLAAQSGSQVADPWRRLETLLVGLAAVALVLLAAFRGDLRRALVPLVPIFLATGWSALLLFVVRVPLNPMSVTLGALVIAISTEFSVLLSERYRSERLAGHDTVEALRRSYHRTGAAVAASGVTAIAGFGVLALSDIRMLRDFGLVTLIDLTVSLLGVLVALPAAVVLSERRAEGSRRRATGRPGSDGFAPSQAGSGHGPA